MDVQTVFARECDEEHNVEERHSLPPLRRTRRAAALVLGAAFAWAACRPKKEAGGALPEGWIADGAGPPDVGKPAADFRLPALNGNLVSLSELRGQVVLVNFWATWCAPCRVEMPEIVRAYERYKSRGFTVLAVNVEDDWPEAAEFAQQYGLPFPVLLDKEGRLSRAWRLRGLPSTIFIDRSGTVAVVHLGPLTAEMIDQRLKSLL
jgi:peroxiredoxin